jgi:hypothetical protein
MSRESVYGVLYPRPLDFPTFEFRLLTLLPALLPAGEDEAHDGIIRCSLRYNFLIERYDDPTGITFPVPDYVALSYCWGDPAITRLIIVNDLPVQVTTNLEAALRALRHQKVETVWIDALCINQLDLLERGLQVMRMGLIYSNASYVIAWIGEEADDSNFALNCLDHRAQMLQDRKLPRGIGHNEPGSGSEIITTEDSVSNLFRRPYWKRVWIIQEISKGREVYVLCGHRRIKWSFLQAAIQGWEFPNKHEVNALDYFREAERKKQRPALEQALSRSKMFLATDVRDKIYGLLGLTSDGSDLVPAPNYLQPATSVYYQLFKGLLSEQRELAYLVETRASSTYHVKSSPSLFQPDWTNLASGTPHWMLLVLGKQLPEKDPRTRRGLNNLLHGPFRTFNSLTLARDSIFPQDTPDRTPELQTTVTIPFLLRDGLQAEIYVLDSIESIGTKFYSSDYWGPGRERAPDNATDESKSATSWNASTHPTWLREQNHQAAKPSHVLKSLCQALFSASFLASSVIMNADSTEMLNFTNPILADIVIDMYEARPGPLDPYHHLSVWFFKNQDLYIHGRKLKNWMDMHLEAEIDRSWYGRFKHKAVSGFRATKSGSKSRTSHTHKSWLQNCDEIKALFEAMNTAASADLRLAVGTHRQIPGLVPVHAEKGDLIALMPHSNLPIVLRPIGDGTARFIGESCIYIYGPPTNETLVRPRPQFFGDYWDLHEDWNESNEIWYPIDFKKKENWQNMRII